MWAGSVRKWATGIIDRSIEIAVHLLVACLIADCLMGACIWLMQVSYIYCQPAAATAKKASTKKQQQPALHERATDPFAALVERRAVDWDEALRQLALPLARVPSSEE